MEFTFFSKWEELPKSAGELFEEKEEESIFFSKIWFQLLLKDNLNKNETLFLACVIKNEKVIALLPMIKNQDSHLKSLRHLYTSLFTILIKKDPSQEIFDCLVGGLDSLSIKSIKIDPIDESDENIKKLKKSLDFFGYISYQHFLFFNWVHLNENRTFESYEKLMPSRLRNTIHRKYRKLKQEAKLEILIYSKHDIKKALEDYHYIHQRSWKAKELFKDFLNNMVFNFSEKNWLRVGVLYINDKPAAAQIWTICHFKASIFKLVYDEKWKHYSPGSVLTSYMIRNMIETEKVKEIDFLYGNDSYKKDWMSHRRIRQSLYSAKLVSKNLFLRNFINFIKIYFNFYKIIIEKLTNLWR